MARVKTIVTGIRSIDRKLAQLPYKIQGKVIRPAMRAGMKVQAEGVRAEVPVDSGLTRRSVKVRATPKKRIAKGSRSTTISMEVVVVAEKGLVKVTKGGKRYFYPALIEFGSRDEPANPFGRRAFNRRGEAARRVTLAHLKAGVDREIKAL